MAVLKKKFFQIEVPVLNDTLEVYAASIEETVGRTIKVDLTRHLKGKNLEAIFEIVKKDGKIYAEAKSALIVSSYQRRIMRKGISYIEDSFVCKTKDGTLRIKPFMMTRQKIHRKLRNALRVKAREILTEFCKEKTSEEVFMAVLEAGIQREISISLKKIYPLSFCEIRAINKEK